MSRIGKIAIVVTLMGAVGVVAAVTQVSSSGPASQPATASALPRLIDLGSVTCPPCKVMAPFLAELKAQCAGRLQVELIDVDKTPSAKGKYGIKLIPTQVFLDASGKELWRHEGFLSKEDILAKWKELGVSLPLAASSQPASGPAKAPAAKSGAG